METKDDRVKKIFTTIKKNISSWIGYEIGSLVTILALGGILLIGYAIWKINRVIGSFSFSLDSLGSWVFIIPIIFLIVVFFLFLELKTIFSSSKEKKLPQEKPTPKKEEPGTAPSSDKDEEAENPNASPSAKDVKTPVEPEKSSDSSDLMKKISELFEIVANVKFWGAIIIAAILCMIIIKGKGCGSGCNGFGSSKKSSATETPTVEQLARTKDSLEKLALQKIIADSLNQSIAYLKKFNKTMDSISGNYQSDQTSGHNQEAKGSATTQKSSGSGSWRDFFSFSGIFSKWKGATASPSENQKSPERASSGPTTSTSPSGTRTGTSSSSYTTNESTLSAFEKEISKPEHWKNNLGDEAMRRYLEGQNQGSDIMKEYESAGISRKISVTKRTSRKYLIDEKTGKRYYYNNEGEPVWVTTQDDEDALKVLIDPNSSNEEFDKATREIATP